MDHNSQTPLNGSFDAKSTHKGLSQVASIPATIRNEDSHDSSRQDEGDPIPLIRMERIIVETGEAVARAGVRHATAEVEGDDEQEDDEMEDFEEEEV